MGGLAGWVWFDRLFWFDGMVSPCLHIQAIFVGAAAEQASCKQLIMSQNICMHSCNGVLIRNRGRAMHVRCLGVGGTCGSRASFTAASTAAGPRPAATSLAPAAPHAAATTQAAGGRR